MPTRPTSNLSVSTVLISFFIALSVFCLPTTIFAAPQDAAGAFRLFTTLSIYGVETSKLPTLFPSPTTAVTVPEILFTEAVATAAIATSTPRLRPGVDADVLGVSDGRKSGDGLLGSTSRSGSMSAAHSRSSLCGSFLRGTFVLGGLILLSGLILAW